MNFDDMDSFLAHFSQVPLSVQTNTYFALKMVSQAIEQTAKDEIGHYQNAVGPYPAWERLADSTLAEHERFGVGDTPLILHGGLYASIQHEINGPVAMIGSTSKIAEYQEFGTSKIPPRPFIGPAVERNRKLLEKTFEESVVYGIEGNVLKAKFSLSPT